MIPAGIRTGEVEFFVDNHTLQTMYSGALIKYANLPSRVHDIVSAAIDAPAAAAMDVMGITDTVERHMQFLRCNCGSFDFTPDIAPDSTMLQREYVQCDSRGVCKHEGLLCKFIVINGNKISLTELRVISHIKAGLQDKEICSRLNIAIDTLRSHKRNIQPKLGALTKVHIATQSIKYGIS